MWGKIKQHGGGHGENLFRFKQEDGELVVSPYTFCGKSIYIIRTDGVPPTVDLT